MTEYGVFNDEGCVESQCFTMAEAQVALAHYYADGEEHLSIHEICPEHEEQPYDSCEVCDSEDEIEEDDEDEDDD